MAITTEQLVDDQTSYIITKQESSLYIKSPSIKISELYNHNKHSLTLSNGHSKRNGSCNNNINKNNISTSNNSNNNKIQTNSLKPMRILIFNESFYPYTSGISRRFTEIIRRLAMRGFKIHVLTGIKKANDWIKINNLKENVSFGILKSVDFKNHIDCALPFLYPQFGILNEINNFKPDVIHVVEHTPAALLCMSVAKILDIPLVCSSHTNIDSYIPLYIHDYALEMSLYAYRFTRKHFLNMAHANLTVSSDFVQLLANSGVKNKIHVWKTGVDSELFNPKYRNFETRLEMFNGHYSPEKILLVSVGRISPEKNFEFLLQVIEKCPETFLCIVGDGPYRKNIESLFPKNRTHFMGFLQGEKLASAYASADYFIYASVSETFGQVYLEAMSSGIPIVAAEGNQMKEFFQNQLHGNTWNPDCVDSAIKALNDTKNDYKRIANNCRLNALNHSWDGAADQIIELYSQFSDYKKNKNLIKLSARGIYYFFKWLALLIIVGLFMAPFVTKPKSLVEFNEKRNKKLNNQTSTIKSSNDKNTFTRLYKIYNKYSSKLFKSNTLCAFLATLSALFLSAILYLHQYLF